MLSSIFRSALTLAASGIVLGVVASAIVVRALAGLLYGIRAENAGMFILASGLLTLTALAASWSSVWRAANIDPIQTLRTE